MYKHRREGGVYRLLDGKIILPRSTEWFNEYIPYFRSGGETLDDDPLIEITKSIEEVRAEKIYEIEQFSLQLRYKSVKWANPAELSTWSRKEDLARKASASGVAADAGILRQEAQKRGITLVQLITKIINKADNFWDIEAEIAGNLGKHLDAINQLNTIEEIKQYDFLNGWPNL